MSYRSISAAIATFALPSRNDSKTLKSAAGMTNVTRWTPARIEDKALVPSSETVSKSLWSEGVR